jgi:hypothetical protein
MTDVWVMCCDDTNGNETYSRELGLSRDPAGRGRRLRLLGQVRASPDEAKQALKQSYARGERPQIVLVDNWLGGHRAPDKAAPAGHELMLWIQSTFGEERPVCVLMSGRMTPTLAYAFCKAGGHHAIDTVRGAPAWHDRLDIVWRALDGERWRPTPSPPKVVFTDDEMELLPYLEAGRGNHETRAALVWNADKLTHIKRNIYSRLKACELIAVEYNTVLTTQLADAALSGGAVWEPLELRRAR